jgi:hypothetical protein
VIGPLVLVAFAGCGSASIDPRATMAPESHGPVGDDRSIASQLVVGFAVAIDGAGENPRLVAVVSHADGTSESHDLGAYRGPMRALAPAGDAVVRVGTEGVEEFVLVPAGGFLEARRSTGSAEELILRIDLPRGSSIEAQTPALREPRTLVEPPSE